MNKYILRWLKTTMLCSNKKIHAKMLQKLENEIKENSFGVTNLNATYKIVFKYSMKMHIMKVYV